MQRLVGVEIERKIINKSHQGETCIKKVMSAFGIEPEETGCN